MFRLLAFLVASAALMVSLSARAATGVSGRDLAKIEQGLASAVVMSFRGGQGFYDAKVTIENVPTGKRFSMLLSITGAVALPPGRYRVVFGSMSGARGNYRTSISYLGLFGDWFEEFDVNPGEVVDLGTLRVAPYDFGSLPAEIGLEMTSVVNGGIGEAFTSYLAYNIDQSSGYLADHFMKDKFPRLTARPVRRPLQRRFDDAVFADALVRAYSRATVTQNPSHRGFEAELKQEIAAAAARNN